MHVVIFTLHIRNEITVIKQNFIKYNIELKLKLEINRNLIHVRTYGSEHASAFSDGAATSEKRSNEDECSNCNKKNGW